MLATFHNYKKVGQMDPNESNFLLAAYNLLWTYIVEKSVGYLLLPNNYGVFFYIAEKLLLFEKNFTISLKKCFWGFFMDKREWGNRRAWSFFMWHIQIGYRHIKNSIVLVVYGLYAFEAFYNAKSQTFFYFQPTVSFTEKLFLARCGPVKTWLLETGKRCVLKASRQKSWF